MKKFIFLLLLSCIIISINAQVTETFEDETTGATSFTLDSRTYNVSGLLFDIEFFSGGGANGSDKMLDNYDPSNSTVGSNEIVTITKTTDNFVINSLYLYLGSNDGSPSGGLIIRGKLSSSVEFTHNISSPALFSWFQEDMSAYNATLIDELEFEFTGNLNYIAIDDLELSTTVLPVELASFEGWITDGGVLLKWETATEVNNYGFEIQKSEAGTQNSEWRKIGFIQGNGTTNSPNNYEFTDSELSNSKEVSYRLKQIDNDGTFEYSKVVTVDLSSITSVDDEIKYKFSLEQNYPNPFNPTTTIKFTVPNVGTSRDLSLQTKLSIYNSLGQQVATLVNEQKSPGVYEVQFDGSSFSSGMYFYKLTSGEFTQTNKLMLLK